MIRIRFFKNKLGLRVGDWVEVKSAEEIFATLDDRGCIDALPFMPEMLQYCGKRFRVFKSAHKTCDTIKTYHTRRMTKAVHLEGVRCDGEAHGGCQAGCLLFWKDAWLKPVSGSEVADDRRGTAETSPAVAGKDSHCDIDALVGATRIQPAEVKDTVERYRCQATEMLQATTDLHWWDPRPYAMDVSSSNVRLRDFIRYVMIAAINVVIRRLHWRLRSYPYMPGSAADKTPVEPLNLQPGELVQVRSKAEIMRTINKDRKNRGLAFDVEMFPYCGKTFRVLGRVERIINDRTGAMMRIPNACLILEGVTCGGCLSRNRLFCPRSIYPYWHEIWLKRVEDEEQVWKVGF
jgi:hypothetical protein